MNSLSPYEPLPGEISPQRTISQPSRLPFVSGTVYSKPTDSGSLGRVLRRWPVVLGTAVFFAVLGAIYCHAKKNIYQSSSEVLLQSPGQQNALASGSTIAALAGLAGVSTGGPDIPTVIEEMTSDPALREVAERTGINPDPSKARSEITIAPHKTSGSIITVTVRDESPQRALAAVSAIVDVYNDHMGHESSTLTGRMIVSTHAQLQQVGAKLAQSEQAYAKYSQAVGSVDPITEAAQKVEQLYELRKEQLDNQRELSGNEYETSFYQKQVAALDPNVVPSLSLAPSPLIQTDQNKLSDLEQQRASLAAQYTPQDDQMVENQKQIDSVREDIREEMQREAATVNSTMGSLGTSQYQHPAPSSGSGFIVNNLTRAVNPLRETARQNLADAQAKVISDRVANTVLTSAISKADQDMSTTPDKMRRLGDLKNDSEVYQKLFDDLEAQLVQLNAARPEDQSYATVLQMPVLSHAPVSPKPALYIPAAAVLGAFAAIILLYFLDLVDPKLRDPSDLAQIADLPVLQRLPCQPRDGQTGKKALAVSQSYQRLASTLSYLGLGSKIKTVMLTGAYSSEGSSSVAANLATALAAAGRKIVLIDATGPHPRIVPLGSEHSVETSPKISNGETNGSASPMKQTLLPTANVSALLQADDSETLMQQLKLDADIVIFDGAPVFEGISTAVLAERVDAVIYVSRLQGVSREEVREALGLVVSGPTPVLGVVLNDSQ